MNQRERSALARAFERMMDMEHIWTFEAEYTGFFWRVFANGEEATHKDLEVAIEDAVQLAVEADNAMIEHLEGGRPFVDNLVSLDAARATRALLR
jgi:hypothetical protein